MAYYVPPANPNIPDVQCAVGRPSPGPHNSVWLYLVPKVGAFPTSVAGYYEGDVYGFVVNLDVWTTAGYISGSDGSPMTVDTISTEFFLNWDDTRKGYTIVSVHSNLWLQAQADALSTPSFTSNASSAGFFRFGSNATAQPVLFNQPYDLFYLETTTSSWFPVRTRPPLVGWRGPASATYSFSCDADSCYVYPNVRDLQVLDMYECTTLGTKACYDRMLDGSPQSWNDQYVWCTDANHAVVGQSATQTRDGIVGHLYSQNSVCTGLCEESKVEGYACSDNLVCVEASGQALQYLKYSDCAKACDQSVTTYSCFAGTSPNQCVRSPGGYRDKPTCQPNCPASLTPRRHSSKPQNHRRHYRAPPTPPRQVCVTTDLTQWTQCIMAIQPFAGNQWSFIAINDDGVLKHVFPPGDPCIPPQGRNDTVVTGLHLVNNATDATPFAMRVQADGRLAIQTRAPQTTQPLQLGAYYTCGDDNVPLNVRCWSQTVFDDPHNIVAQSPSWVVYDAGTTTGAGKICFGHPYNLYAPECTEYLGVGATMVKTAAYIRQNLMDLDTIDDHYRLARIVLLPVPTTTDVESQYWLCGETGCANMTSGNAVTRITKCDDDGETTYCEDAFSGFPLIRDYDTCFSQCSTKAGWTCDAQSGDCILGSSGTGTKGECQKTCAIVPYWSCNATKQTCYRDAAGIYSDETACSTKCSSPSSKPSKVGVIVGIVIGFLVVVGIVGVVVAVRKAKHPQHKASATQGNSNTSNHS